MIHPCLLGLPSPFIMSLALPYRYTSHGFLAIAVGARSSEDKGAGRSKVFAECVMPEDFHVVWVLVAVGMYGLAEETFVEECRSAELNEGYLVCWDCRADRHGDCNGVGAWLTSLGDGYWREGEMGRY